MSEESFDVEFVGAEPSLESFERAAAVDDRTPAKKRGRPKKESAPKDVPAVPKKPKTRVPPPPVDPELGVPVLPAPTEPLPEISDVERFFATMSEYELLAADALIEIRIQTTKTARHVACIHAHHTMQTRLQAVQTALLAGACILLLLK